MTRLGCGSLIILAVFNLLSCIRVTNLDAGEGPLVAVECILTDSPVQTLSLCYSKGSSRERMPLTEAEACLYDESAGSLAGIFSRSDDGLWTLNYTPESLHRYKLVINVPGYDPIVAEQIMPDIEVKAVYYFPLLGDFGNYEYNSYPLIIYEIASFPEFTWIYAMNCDEISSEYVLVDNLCTDYPYVDNFNLTGAVYSPQVDTVFQAGSELHKALCWPLRGSSMHSRYLRIPHSESTGKNWMILSGDMTGTFQYERELTRQWQFINDGVIDSLEFGLGYVVFASLSEDYDLYMKDAVRLQSFQESDDLSSRLIRENCYSNIQGGVGIFGAMKEQKMVWMNEKSTFFDETAD